MELVIVLLETQSQLMQIPLSYLEHWSNLQTRFLIWKHYSPCTLVRDKNILNKIFDNLLLKLMFSCLRIKIIFIEYKHFGSNTNIFYWKQIYFLKYQILFSFFIAHKYIFNECKCIFLNTNIFFIYYKYIFSLNTKIIIIT